MNCDNGLFLAKHRNNCVKLFWVEKTPNLPFKIRHCYYERPYFYRGFGNRQWKRHGKQPRKNIIRFYTRLKQLIHTIAENLDLRTDYVIEVLKKIN